METTIRTVRHWHDDCILRISSADYTRGIQLRTKELSEWQLRMADPMAVRRLAGWLNIQDAPFDLDKLIPMILGQTKNWQTGWSMY